MKKKLSKLSPLNLLYSLGHPVYLLLVYLFTPLKYLISRLPRLLPCFTKKNLLIGFLLLIIIFLSVDIYYLYEFLHSLPSPNTLKTRDVPLTTKIYDRSGNLLYKIYDQSHNRTLVNLEKLPQCLIQATIAIEDKDFYTHGALSVRGITRAFRQNLSGDFQGGSTITQQLVKNALLTPDRSFERKLKEIILAFQAELIFTKDEILQMYFNEVGYGGTTYGVEEASQMYFDKPASNLNLAESAFLAGLPAAPTYFSPYGAHPELAKKRQEEVLRRMQEDGYITKSQNLKTKEQKLSFIPRETNIKAPHFVMYVKDLLVRKYGEKKVAQGGLSVFTSLDLNLQNEVQRFVSTGVSKQKYLNVGNGAALVVNPQTGEILSMIGSVNYFDIQNDGNVNVVLMPRQPGSAIKPVNYAAAFALKKITPSSVVYDSPITYQTVGSPPYSPQDYDGRFRGKVTVRQALASSLNVPAVKILNSYGVENMLEFGEKMGITTWTEKNRFGLSLTLGGGEVTMLDMVQAYGIFPNLGKKVPLQPILKVLDHKSNVLFASPNPLLARHSPDMVGTKAANVLSSGVSYLINNILADNNARSLVFGPNSLLVIPNHTVSVKTGTTESKKDNWTVGYTKDFLTAVWIGNNDSSPMSPYLESGATGAAPIWHNIMVYLLKDQKNLLLEIPPDIVKIEICKETGLPPCGPCTKVSEYYLVGTQPQVNCHFQPMRQTEER